MAIDLKEIRKQIDAIDGKLLDLLNQRLQLVLEVGRIKHVSGQEIYAPEREQALLKRLALMNKGPMPENSLKAIYREIMSTAISLEKPVVIATLAPKGSTAHQVAQAKFGKSLHYKLEKNMRALFQAVNDGKADYGVVPVEVTGDNSLLGVFDLFIDFPLKICAQIAPAKAGEKNKKAGEPADVTRYFVIGRKSPPPTGSDRTTVLFSLPDHPGALAKALGTLAKGKVNLIKIESRPSWRAGFKFHFVIDLDGHEEEATMKKALAVFSQSCNAIKIIGSYPC